MDHAYKKIEIVGTSEKSVSDAVQTAIDRASRTVNHIGWFEVDEIRGAVKEGNVLQYQVTVRIGFRVED